MDFYSSEDVRACDDIREEPQEYIISQYANSPHICGILDNFRKTIMADGDIGVFYKNIMDIDTANGKGLNVLGNIVNISRTVEMSYRGKRQRFTLNDEQYRRMILYRALANITDSSGYNINKMMDVLFNGSVDTPMVLTIIHEQKRDDGAYYNSYPMHVRWVINNKLSDMDLALFQLGGTLCLGAGVGWILVAVNQRETFGFLGSNLQPFNQGHFWDGSYLET